MFYLDNVPRQTCVELISYGLHALLTESLSELQQSFTRNYCFHILLLLDRYVCLRRSQVSMQDYHKYLRD